MSLAVRRGSAAASLGGVAHGAPATATDSASNYEGNLLTACSYKHGMRILAVELAFLFLSTAATGQMSSALYDEIAAMDKKLFDAFNARDIEIIGSIFDTTLEFYHDRGGLTGYDQTMKQSKEIFSKPSSPRRELVPGTLEVYPIPNYGAVQIGAHRFCHDDNGKPDCGLFKFVHVWQKKDGNWKLTRVVSYGH